MTKSVKIPKGGEVLISKFESDTLIEVISEGDEYSYSHHVKDGIRIIINPHLLEMADEEKSEAINTTINQQNNKPKVKTKL